MSGLEVSGSGWAVSGGRIRATAVLALQQGIGIRKGRGREGKGTQGEVRRHTARCGGRRPAIPGAGRTAAHGSRRWGVAAAGAKPGIPTEGGARTVRK